MKNIKISNEQIKAITASYVCGASTIIISSSATEIAKQDAWISGILATIFGLLLVWFNIFLYDRYPDKTYVEILQLLLGKWFGGFIALNIILICIVGASDFVWYIGDFFTTEYMPETSPNTIKILFVAVNVIAVIYGIEVIARASEIFYSIIFILFILAMVLVMPNVKIDNLLPVFEKGIGPILKGTLPLMAFGSMQFILLNMIFPINIKDIKKAKKSIYTGYLLGMFITVVSILMSTLVLGSTLTSAIRYPIYFLTKEINVGIILTRLEALIIFVWILTLFNNSLIYFYSGIIALSRLLKLKDHKNIILPMGLIFAVLSDYIFENVPYEINWDTTVWPPYIATFGAILPMVLIIISVIKKHKKVIKAD